MQGCFASALIAVSLVAFAPQTAVSKSQWKNDYGQALATTRQVHKPLLVVLDKPGDAQHRIEQIHLVKEQSPTGPDAKLLESYELCHVDASTEYGRQVAKAFKVQQLPYVAIIDKSGRKIVYQKSGRLTDAEWQAALTTHQAGELPQAAPVSYSHLLEPQGFYGLGNCPSCQRGW